MTTQMTLYEGHVVKVETRGKWFAVFTEREKPVAFLTSSFTGPLPEVGSKISVQAVEGKHWFFGEHRSLSAQKPEAYFPVEELPNNTRTALVVNLIMGWLQNHPQVCGDDIYEAATSRAPDADPRFIGHGFRFLAHKGVIHRVGTKKSVRVKQSHASDMYVWERTKQKGDLA